MQRLGRARLHPFRALHVSLTHLVTSLWIRMSPTLGRMLSYAKTPVDHKFGPGYPFSFVQIPPATEANTRDNIELIETDVLVIGSGCSGAVAAAVLAEAELSVIVAEKGYHWSPKHLPMTEEAGMVHLFYNGGIVLSDSGSMHIGAGSCFGGGGTVNWSASLQLQGFVREEWATKHGLPYFTSGAFQADMDAVCERMGVGTAAIKHNFGNQKLLSGARKLGMNGKSVPQNTNGEAHQCGYCSLGCGSCGKKGPTESWLPDAARKGARFIEGFECTRVLFSDGKDKVAIGAEGIWTSRDEHSGVSGACYSRTVRIMAHRAVIVAAGAFGTPHLLQRSGIRNPHLGSHLHLHPVSFCAAVFDHDVRPWEGGILTSVVNDLENVESSGYGVKLECTSMIPGIFLPLFPWTSGLEWKIFCAKMRRMTGYISLARDQGEGKVYVDPQEPGRVRVQYDVDKKDQKHISMGLVELAKILFVEGAREIHVSVPGVPHFVRQGTISASADDTEEGVNNHAFQEWLTNLKALVSRGMSSETSFASAHQMGTARMGSTPRTSVVDPTGQVWGSPKLYVADASAFPAASGVNPMITTMALSRGIARGIVARSASDGYPHGALRAHL